MRAHGYRVTGVTSPVPAGIGFRATGDSPRQLCPISAGATESSALTAGLFVCLALSRRSARNLLHALCSAIDNPVSTNGRPRLLLSEAIFCAVMTIYGGPPARRSMVDMQKYAEGGYILH